MGMLDFNFLANNQLTANPTSAGGANLTGFPTTTANVVPAPFNPGPAQPLSNQVAGNLQQFGVQPPPITNAPTDFSKFGDINTQNAIRGIISDRGLTGAVDVINGVVVDAQGNPIAGAPSQAEFGQLIEQRLNPAQLTVNPSNPGGTQLSPDGQNLQLQAPQTGLIGSEQALIGGAVGAESILREGLGFGAEAVRQGSAGAESLLREGAGFGIDELRAANVTGQDQLQAARDRSGQSFRDTFGMATNQLGERFGNAGFQANQQQAALSGALGAEAQAAAFANFTDSPGQQFLRDQQEQALLRNASATGGLGGGRVLEALQRQAAGNAAQNFQQNFQNLGEVAGRGLAAEQQRAQIGGALGGQFLGQQGNIDLAGVDLTQGLGNQLANIGLSAGTTGAGIRQNEGSQLANIGITGGVTGAQLFRGTGQDIARGRLDTGRQIADAISTTTSGLSALSETGGARVAEIIGTGGGNLVNIISAAAQQSGVSAEAFATHLSNLAVQQGTSVANMVSGANLIPQGANLETTANLISAAGSLISQFGTPPAAAAT